METIQVTTELRTNACWNCGGLYAISKRFALEAERVQPAA